MKSSVRIIDPRSPKAPNHLSDEGKNLWREICDDWEFESADLAILESALEALDRMRQAQVALKKDGLFVTDRYGIKKPHPAISIERESKMTMARLFKAIHINPKPVKERLGRPPGGQL